MCVLFLSLQNETYKEIQDEIWYLVDRWKEECGQALLDTSPLSSTFPSIATNPGSLLQPAKRSVPIAVTSPLVKPVQTGTSQSRSDGGEGKHWKVTSPQEARKLPRRDTSPKKSSPTKSLNKVRSPDGSPSSEIPTSPSKVKRRKARKVETVGESMKAGVDPATCSSGRLISGDSPQHKLNNVEKQPVDSSTQSTQNDPKKQVSLSIKLRNINRPATPVPQEKIDGIERHRLVKDRRAFSLGSPTRAEVIRQEPTKVKLSPTSPATFSPVSSQPLDIRAGQSTLLSPGKRDIFSHLKTRSAPSEPVVSNAGVGEAIDKAEKKTYKTVMNISLSLQAASKEEVV